ncbi:MAG TPA: hypothetical protein VF623_11380 [Segetibacter sp.]|jgi:hypothetical protein
MKKLCFLLLAFSFALTLQFCSSAKKSVAAIPKVTYMGNIAPLVQSSCAPCHFPPKGNKKPYDTYVRVKSDIDEILVRIQKNPDEKGFMPMRHPKLSDSTINVIRQWKADGLLEM